MEYCAHARQIIFCVVHFQKLSCVSCILENYFVCHAFSKLLATHSSLKILQKGLIRGYILYYSIFLTLFVPAYFDVSGTRGGHIVPPLNIFGLGRVRFQFFLEITCLGVIYHIQKDS